MKPTLLALATLTLVAGLALGGLAEGTLLDVAPTASAGEICRPIKDNVWVCVWCPDTLCPFPWN